MAAKWKINNLNYYLSKDSKDKVVYKVDYSVLDTKTVGDKEYSASDNMNISFDVETVESVEAKDAVLYTDKDTLLADKAVKVGDIKTPAVEAAEAKDPWASVDFVEYDKLTEDVVIGWVKAELGEDGVKTKEDNIAAQIDAQKNPPAVTKGSGVPW
tara:strand:- start:14046 stop:14513 length:468 start_codon:yes stop_codon:yes gene_type:complete